MRGQRGLPIRDEIDVEMALDHTGTSGVSVSPGSPQAPGTTRVMSFRYDGEGGPRGPLGGGRAEQGEDGDFLVGDRIPVW